MNRFLLKILWSALGFIPLYIVFIGAMAFLIKSNYVPNIQLSTAGTGYLLSRLREADTTRNVDILILGSSHAYRGFDTRLFNANGFKAFNLGSSIQTPVQSFYLLDHYLDQLDPKAVIIEVYPPTFSNDGTESATDILSNHSPDWKLVKYSLQAGNVIVLNTVVYQVFKQLRRPLKEVREPTKRGPDTYISGGFVEYSGDQHPVVNNRAYVRKEFVFNERQVKYFKRILTVLEDRGINVSLIYAPLPHFSLNEFHNHAEVLTFYKDLERQYSGVKFYDYSQFFSRESELNYFYDHHHLNQLGVVEFNTDFIKKSMLGK